MKKLMIMVLLATLYAFGGSCTPTSVEEEDYGIQVINKKEVETPTEKKDTPKEP